MLEDSNFSCPHTGQFWVSSESLLTTFHQSTHLEAFHFWLWGLLWPCLRVTSNAWTCGRVHAIETTLMGTRAGGQMAQSPVLTQAILGDTLNASQKFWWHWALVALEIHDFIGFSWFPISLFHPLAPLLLAGMTSQITYLHLKPYLKFCFR